MKKLSMVVALILTATLVCGAACAAEPEEEFAAFEEYGRVLSVEERDRRVIEAEGYFGYHMDEALHDRESGNRSGLSDPFRFRNGAAKLRLRK